MKRTKRISSVDVSVNNGRYFNIIDVTVHHREADSTKYINNRSYHCFDWKSPEHRARFLARAQRMQTAFYNRSLMEVASDE